VSGCLIDWGKSCTQRIPQNVLTLSREVDECKPLELGKPDNNVRQWMLEKELKERERAKMKKRMLGREKK